MPWPRGQGFLTIGPRKLPCLAMRVEEDLGGVRAKTPRPFVLPVLMALLAGCATTPHPEDRWFAEDKAKHFAACGILGAWLLANAPDGAGESSRAPWSGEQPPYSTRLSVSPSGLGALRGVRIMATPSVSPCHL